jgi:hypothetical protein
MLKYKNKYQVRYEKDIKGVVYNKDDNYIACRAQGKIYRKDKDTLVFISPKKIRLYKRDKETKEIIEDYQNLVLSVWDTDAEREIEFKEQNLEKLEDILKIRKRRKVSEEFKKAAKERFQKMWAEKKGQNSELSDEELEDLIEDEVNDIEDTDDEE